MQKYIKSAALGTGINIEFKDAADQSPALIWMAGTDGLCNWFNKGWLEFTGRTIEQELGNGWTEGVFSEDLNLCVEQYLNHFNAHEHFLLEYRLRRYDGQYRWILDSGTPILDAAGVFQGYNGVCFDITERKESEEERRIAAVAFEAQQGMIVTDINKVVVRVNSAFARLTGYAADEIIGKTPKILQSGRHDPFFYAELWKSITNQGYWHGEIWNRRKTGELFPALLTITAVNDERGKHTHYVGCFSDISSRVANEKTLRDLAFYDPLTGLANRRLFNDRLSQAIAKSARNSEFCAVLYIDLDHFKKLNDTHGHPAGDHLLEIVADRLATNVRAGDTVSRFGGDEFVLLLEGIGDTHDQAEKIAVELAENIRSKLIVPYTIHSSNLVEWNMTVSIGIALFSGHKNTLREILELADKALYAAKQSGRNAIRMVVGP
jgi:diguanylate cyclase (GGDEF)-like protein/PAS domain S-box-containing protein